MTLALQIGFTYKEILWEVPFALLLQCLHAHLYAEAKKAGHKDPIFEWVHHSDQVGVKEEINRVLSQPWLDEDNLISWE